MGVFIQHNKQNRLLAQAEQAGAVEIGRSTNMYAVISGSSVVFESLVRSSYLVPRGSNRDRDRLVFFRSL